jgi:hypothetical protein
MNTSLRVILYISNLRTEITTKADNILIKFSPLCIITPESHSSLIVARGEN